MDYDKGISLKDVQVLSKASVFIEDTQKKDKVIYSMTKDYNDGEFNDAEKYAELLENICWIFQFQWGRVFARVIFFD